MARFFMHVGASKPPVNVSSLCQGCGVEIIVPLRGYVVRQSADADAAFMRAWWVEGGGMGGYFGGGRCLPHPYLSVGGYLWFQVCGGECLTWLSYPTVVILLL